MTSLSTTAAIGMMPLNLYLYTRGFTSTSMSIPFVKIIIGLVLILVPVSIGMFVLEKFPKVAKVVVQVS